MRIEGGNCMIEITVDFSEWEQYGDMDDGRLVLHDASGECADLYYTKARRHDWDDAEAD